MTEVPKRAWEQRLQEAASNIEDELRRVVTYLNEEVVPEVRQNGSSALRKAAVELERLARKMEDRRGSSLAKSDHQAATSFSCGAFARGTSAPTARSKSQIRHVLSLLDEAKRRPSAAKDNDMMSPRCPRNARISLPVAVSQR